MLNQEQIKQIRLWWDVFKHGGDLVEIRCIGDKVTYSGYYKDIEHLIRDVGQHDDCNVYFTINPINDSCHGRPQCENMIRNPKNTTTDAEIVGRTWVFVDFDCEKVTNVNSTNEEKEFAHRKALEVYRYLKKEGFNESVVVDSSNGYHLYIPCLLKANEENDTLVAKFLKSLSMMFSDEHVSIDVKTANRSRIAKLAGTYSRKGSALSADRPQRMCKILKVPSEIEPTPKEYFQKIADLYPEEEVKPTRENNYSTEKFDVEGFLNKYGLEYRTVRITGGTRYILKECPFGGSAHKDPDSMVFQHDNGAIAFMCYHNSCSHYTWRDLRLKYQPDAYDKKDYHEFRAKQKYYERYSLPKEPTVLKDENEQDGKKWLALRDIKTVKDSERFAIHTGIYALDKAIGGFYESETTLLSGINASGKTAILNQLLLTAVQQGVPSALWSGELPASRLKAWLCQTAAGKQNVTKVPNSESSYEANDDVIPKIEEWLDERLIIYNNNYGNNFEQIISDIIEAIEKYGLRFIVLDNLMALSLDDLVGDKNERQKQLMMRLDDLAKKYKVHVLIIAHPRKEASFQLLRKESISGTSDLTNIVWNLLLIHRVGDDFEKRANEFWGKERTNKLILEGYNNIIEVAKNRDYGIADYTVGLFYEMETRRFKNSKAENIHYDWEERYEEYIVPEPTSFGQIAPNPSFDTPIEPIYHKDNEDVYWGQFRDDTPPF